MKRLVVLGLVLASVSVSAQVTSIGFTSSFEPDFLPLESFTGSWASDHQQITSAQEIGGLGLATGTGSAATGLFGPAAVNPLDVGATMALRVDTHGFTSPLTLTFFDNKGGSDTWTINPPAVSGYQIYRVDHLQLPGDADWQAIQQFSVSGNGTSDPYHVTLDFVGVPEPSHSAMAVGLLLLGALVHRKFTKAHKSQ